MGDGRVEKSRKLFHSWARRHMGGDGGARGQQPGPLRRWPCLSWDYSRLGHGRDSVTVVMSLGAGEDGGRHLGFSRPLPSSIPPVPLVGQIALLQQRSEEWRNVCPWYRAEEEQGIVLRPNKPMTGMDRKWATWSKGFFYVWKNLVELIECYLFSTFVCPVLAELQLGIKRTLGHYPVQ